MKNFRQACELDGSCLMVEHWSAIRPAQASLAPFGTCCRVEKYGVQCGEGIDQEGRGWRIAADSWTPQVEVDGHTLLRPQMADCQMVNDVVMLVGLGPETRERPDEPRKVRGRLVGTVSQLPRKASGTQFTSLLTDTVLASARPVTATARHAAACVQSPTSMTFGKLDYCMPSCGCVLPAYIWWSRVGNRRVSEWSRVGSRRVNEWSRVGNRRGSEWSRVGNRRVNEWSRVGNRRGSEWSRGELCSYQCQALENYFTVRG